MLIRCPGVVLRKRHAGTIRRGGGYDNLSRRDHAKRVEHSGSRLAGCDVATRALTQVFRNRSRVGIVGHDRKRRSRVAGGDQGNLLILGVDMLGDRSLRNYDMEASDGGGSDDSIDDPLVFLAQADSLFVTKTFADARGLKVNSRVPM